MGVYEKDGETFFGEPEDEGTSLRCAACGGFICAGQTVAYEPATNKWRHQEPKCEDMKEDSEEGPDE